MGNVRTMERRLFFRRQTDRSPSLSSPPVAPLERVEWGGIWAGYAVFSGIAVLLMFLVLAFGFSSINPVDVSSWLSIGSVAAIWSGLIILISVFIGAWVGARVPACSKRQGMLRGLTLWGLLMITAVVLFGWMATYGASMAVNVAPATLRNVGSLSASDDTHAATASPDLRSDVQSAIRANGLHVSSATVARIAAQLSAGDREAADSTLSRAGDIPPTRADSILNQVTLAPAAVAAEASGAPTNTRLASAAGELAGGAARGIKTVAWVGFWMSLLSLACAVLGGTLGGRTG